MTPDFLSKVCMPYLHKDVSACQGPSFTYNRDLQGITHTAQSVGSSPKTAMNLDSLVRSGQAPSTQTLERANKRAK